MKLPIYKVLKISHKRYSHPPTLTAEWISDDMVVCGQCVYNEDGICTNVYGMYEHGIDDEDYCSRGEKQ